jgi:hypothetical protein
MGDNIYGDSHQAQMTDNPLSAADESPETKFIQVQLPRGTGPGSHLNVRIPSGELVTIIVPPGAEPGSYIRTPLASAATVPSAATPPRGGGDSMVEGARRGRQHGRGGGDSMVGGEPPSDEPAQHDWVATTLDAEAAAVLARRRIWAGAAVGFLALCMALMAESEFEDWSQFSLTATCAAVDGEAPDVAWNARRPGQPYSTPVDLQMFTASEEQARVRGCTCADLSLADCSGRDTRGHYDGNAVGPRVGTAHAAPTIILPAMYTGNFVDPVVILGLPPRHDEYSAGGNEPRVHIANIDPEAGRFTFALRPRCGEAVDQAADGSPSVQISWMVVETGETADIAAGKATSACSGGSLCSTAAGCNSRSCAQGPERAAGLEPIAITFRRERRSPLVLTQLQTHAHGRPWASASLEDVTDTGFSSRVIPEPSGGTEPPSEHPTELIGWVALSSAAMGSMDGLAFEALGVPLSDEIPFAYRPTPASGSLAIFGDIQDEHWSSASDVRQDHVQYRHSSDGRVTVNVERSDCGASGRLETQQSAVSTVALLSIEAGLAGVQSRSERPPCLLSHPCHYTEDGACDEPQGTGLCAAGSDTADCGDSQDTCRPALLEVGHATRIRWGATAEPRQRPVDQNREEPDRLQCCAFAFSERHGWNASWYLETNRALPLDACCSREEQDGFTWLVVAILLTPVALATLGWTMVDCCLACGCNRNFEYSQTYVRSTTFRALDQLLWIAWMSWFLIMKPEVSIWRHLTVLCVILNLCFVFAAARQKHQEAADALEDAIDSVQTPRQPVDQVDPSSDKLGPSVLRCGSCHTVFGLPAGTTVEQAARCPHCSAVNRQPPTFSTKFGQFQARMDEQRRHLQRQRKARDSLKVQVLVARDAVFQSSMIALAELPGHVIRMRPLVITFPGEEGMDQGGVTREWIDLLFSEKTGVLDENWGMFRKADTNDYVSST